LGLGEIANPAKAHSGYDQDERVIAIMANGFGHKQTAAVVRQRCQWTEVIDLD
jgi:hypothetical protein